jgi:hypothetical protein
MVMAAFGSCNIGGLPGFSPPPPAPGSPTRIQIEELLARVQIVAARGDAVGYERGCKSGEAPLTELNAERCRSEGVGSMWVGSLRT